MKMKQKLETILSDYLSSHGHERERFSLLDIPQNSDFGDYTTTLAFQLASHTGQDVQKIAQDMKAYMESQKLPFVEKVEIAGKGYVNFFLSKAVLCDQLAEILEHKGQYGRSEIGKGKTVVVDYSSPNIAKAFGVGHLRSTIIGHALSNLYEYSGYKVIRDNHIGDWGAQFGKLLFQIEKEGVSLDDLTIDDMERMYVQFHADAERDPSLQEQARAWLERLEEGDERAQTVWKVCREKSMEEFERIYHMLGVSFDVQLGESFYVSQVKDIIEEANDKGITRRSEGALIVEFPDETMPPVVLEKSNGVSTYLAKDLATVRYRIQEWNPDMFLYEVGSDQTLYLKQLFAIVEMLGWADGKTFVHIAHGLIRAKEGKFSTRKGHTIHLEDVLEEAVERAQGLIQESKTEHEFSPQESERVARQVGIGAVKYNDLSQHPAKDMVFSWEKMLNLKGNSGPYIQYVYTRCMSVLRKSDHAWSTDEARTYSKWEKQEDMLCRLLVRFPFVVQDAVSKNSAHVLCEFLFQTAHTYNVVYAERSILRAPSPQERAFLLLLTACTGHVLHNGLSLLGIEAPEKM